ncbi:MAG TPA: hypothetical protein ENG80_02610 [Nitrospirae bacterium]|nr:hypothetical protein [Nitrospirota bacterium]
MAGLSGVLDALRQINGVDAKADESVKSVEGALPLLEDAAFFLRDYKDSLDFDPRRLEVVQERQELIRSLKRKYGKSVKDILDYGDRAEKELDDVQHSGEKLEALKTELGSIKKTLTEKARQLSKKRKAVSKKIDKQAVKELAQLSMIDTDFLVRISNDKGDDTTDGFKVNSGGIDRVEFLISPNIGEELRPLSKTASGGELSRVMLALKGILAKGDSIPVLVFDEIDAGIGGKAAETVGQKLKNLSSGHQEICITHLPQIASYADNHLKIEKKVEGGRTVVEVRKIEKDERTEEIARMLSGDSSEVSIKHAEEMIRSKSNT